MIVKLYIASNLSKTQKNKILKYLCSLAYEFSNSLAIRVTEVLLINNDGTYMCYTINSIPWIYKTLKKMKTDKISNKP